MKKVIAISLLLGLFIGCEKSSLLEDTIHDAEPALQSSLTLLSTPTDLIVPDDYLTIQEAVDAAEDGATITIKEGIYPELVSIHWRKDITLIGENATLCPPADIINGEGSFNISILESSNIKLMNLIFDGKPEGKVFPIDRAIAFTVASGEASYNTISGYAAGIACFYVSEDPFPDPEASLNIKISHNRISECFGQSINLIGNYDAIIDQNVISLNYQHCPSFAEYFDPNWYGIEMHGGTGIISKNKIRLKKGPDYPLYSVGIRLMKSSTNPDIQDYIIDLHDMLVKQNMIHRTDIGISLNSEEDYATGWSVYGLSLQYNHFIQVPDSYLIFNNGVPVEIIP